MGNCFSEEEYDMSKLGFNFFSEERIIGKGGFGIVYAVRKKFASDEENIRFFAAKVSLRVSCPYAVLLSPSSLTCI